jgi:hypothetical protein
VLARTVKVLSKYAAPYGAAIATDARITQDPDAVKATTPVELFTVQPVAPAFCTEYVIAPVLLDAANSEGVIEPATS